MKSLSSYGNLTPGDEIYSESKQKLIKCMSALYKQNEGNEVSQDKIHGHAKRLRKFDDSNITKAYFLNDFSGAFYAGHNAVMLVDKNGRAVVFSVYSSNTAKSIYTYAELHFSSLAPDQVEAFFNNIENKSTLYSMPSTDGTIASDEYDSFVEFELSNSENGKKMFDFAVNRYNFPGDYQLLSKNCDHFTVDCFKAGGIDIEKSTFPNITENNAREL